MNQPKVAICLPSHGGAFRKHEKCLAELRRARPTWQTFELAGMPCIDIGRASIAESVLRWAKDERAILLWIDADMTFTAETCDQIVAEADARDAVVGCLYAGKSFGGRPQVVFNEAESLTCFKGGSLVEVKAIGFGVVAHPSNMLERIAERLFLPRLKILDLSFRPWFTTASDGSWEQMHSDDYAFCRRAREAGFRIFADTRQRVGHIGEHVYHLEDCVPLRRFESLVYQHVEESEAGRFVDLPEKEK